MPIARRGELWQVDLGIVGKVRPALVLSVAFLDHERALFTIVPHTTSVRATRFEVNIPVPGLGPGAFDAQGIRPIPAAALIRKLAVLPSEQMQRVEHAVSNWLGLSG